MPQKLLVRNDTCMFPELSTAVSNSKLPKYGEKKKGGREY
jgi:hypothetical protein